MTAWKGLNVEARTRWSSARLVSVLLVGALNGCGAGDDVTEPRVEGSHTCTVKKAVTLFEHDGTGVCTPLSDPDPSAPGIFTGWSESSCFHISRSTEDLDFDGVNDSCERANARAFRPMLVFSSKDCDWDHGLGRMGGEYFYAVQRKEKFDPATNGLKTVLRIAYLPAYYWDCGNASSIEPISSFDPSHSGDSEFIIIDLVYDASVWAHHWLTDAVFLSSHCGTSNDEKCRWWGPTAFSFWVDDKVLGAPFVWVSLGKHANYPSEKECDDQPAEECILDILQRFPVDLVQQNIGSRAYPFPWLEGGDCRGPFSTSSIPDAGETECFWTWEEPSCVANPFGDPVRCNTPAQTFRGWQREDEGARPMPYGQILEQFAGF